MQLKTLLRAISPSRVVGTVDREVGSLTYDSKRVEGNSLFIALPGETTDGHQFVTEAIERGATVVLGERDGSSPRATFVIVPNSRLAAADLASAFYGYPSRKLKMVAVTGTNGKTTTSFLVKHICVESGMRCGLIGTVRYEIGERILPAVRTTPEAPDLQELLRQVLNAGCRAAVMEVSSHALAQARTRGIEWDVAVFSNLTQDHLDFHRTMENYFAAKAALFDSVVNQTHKKHRTAVINLDDRYGQRLVDRINGKIPVITYGMSLRADFRASNYRTESAGTSYQLDARGRSYLVRVPLIGRFNVANSMAAIAAANAVGISVRTAILSLARAPQVPGRLELVPARRQFQIFVDYAHTPDALSNVLKTVRELEPRKLIVVFGCGGNRDRHKRPLMARVADELADYAVITSDNPRKENPDDIIADAEKGFRSTHYEKIPDRAEAIAHAISLAQARDVIVIAGKGHETYQEFADHTVPFDDIQVAQRALENQAVQFS